jgi:hypothetical protein
MFSNEHCKGHASGAKALVDSAGLFVGVENPGLPVPAYHPSEFFRILWCGALSKLGYETAFG